MTEYSQFSVAVVQAAPIYLDREASTDKACRLIREAANKGASLVAFSETWLPGYPFFVGDAQVHSAVQTEYLERAVEIPSPTTDRLCEVAQEADIDVAIGIAERDAQSRGTVYCTLLFIGREGIILGRHRKLKPTFTERAIWGEGDGSSLVTYERPYGRISGLNCWEHSMLLPAYSLMAQGTQIHIAAWPAPGVLHGAAWKGLLLSQAFALQGSCYVMVPCALLSQEDIPERYHKLFEGSWNGGSDQIGSCIIAPGGDIVAHAPGDEETIVTATISLDAFHKAKTVLDVGGHYSRPDVFQLHVNRTVRERVVQINDFATNGVETESKSKFIDFAELQE